MDRFNILKDRFNKKESHVGKLMAKITTHEFISITRFVEERRSLDKGAFEKDINRWFLDSSDKPKNWAIMSEILSCINTAAGE